MLGTGTRSQHLRYSKAARSWFCNTGLIVLCTSLICFIIILVRGNAGDRYKMLSQHLRYSKATRSGFCNTGLIVLALAKNYNIGQSQVMLGTGTKCYLSAWTTARLPAWFCNTGVIIPVTTKYITF